MQLDAQQVTVMLPVRDLVRAREFYERALALPSGEEKLDGKVVYHCGGTEIAPALTRALGYSPPPPEPVVVPPAPPPPPCGHRPAPDPSASSCPSHRAGRSTRRSG